MSATMTEERAVRLINESALAIDQVWGMLEDEGLAANGLLVPDMPTDDAVRVAQQLLPELGRLASELTRLVGEAGNA